MKKLLLNLFTLSISVYTFAQGGYLPNSGFENWTNTTIFSNPDQWQTSNFSEGDVANATPSTDAQHLSSSLLLQTVLSGNGQDTLFAYAFLGQVGNQGPDGGFPYTSNVDQLKGYYKGTIMPNDTAIAMVMKFLGGNLISMDMLPITTSQSNWTAFTLNLTAGAQDSIFVGFISTNPFFDAKGIPGTSVWFDNVSLEHSTLGAGAALPNNSFETWVPVTSNNPDGWTTINDRFASSGLIFVTETADANSGSKAAQIEPLETQYGDTIPGFLIYGEFDLNQGQILPVPYNASPVNLSGFYKYTPALGDQANISMEFYNNGNLVGGNSIGLSPSVNYSSFTMPTNIVSTPDSMVLVFFAGEKPGSILKVDDVQFSGGDLGIDDFNFTFDFSTYPNPAVGYLTILTEGIESNYEVSILDLSGKLLSSQAFSQTQNATINVSDLANGIYYISLNYKGKYITKSFSVIK